VAEAEAIAGTIWHKINLPNLTTNVLPTRERARLVIRLNALHALDEIWIKKT
jgi:type I pantothenate kinase